MKIKNKLKTIFATTCGLVATITACGFSSFPSRVNNQQVPTTLTNQKTTKNIEETNEDLVQATWTYELNPLTGKWSAKISNPATAQIAIVPSVDETGRPVEGCSGFSNCPELLKIILNDNIESFMTNPKFLYFVPKLQELHIGKNFKGDGGTTYLNNNGVGAFKVIVDKQNPFLDVYGDENKGQVVFPKGFYFNNGVAMFAWGDITIPEGIGRLRGGCLQYQPITSITLPKDLEFVGDRFCNRCSHLGYIKFNWDDTSPQELRIGDRAFCINNSSQTLHINYLPPNLISVGDYAFWGAGKYDKILTIPNALTQIGQYAFYTVNKYNPNLGNESVIFSYDWYKLNAGTTFKDRELIKQGLSIDDLTTTPTLYILTPNEDEKDNFINKYKEIFDLNGLTVKALLQETNIYATLDRFEINDKDDANDNLILNEDFNNVKIIKYYIPTWWKDNDGWFSQKNQITLTLKDEFKPFLDITETGAIEPSGEKEITFNPAWNTETIDVEVWQIGNELVKENTTIFDITLNGKTNTTDGTKAYQKVQLGSINNDYSFASQPANEMNVGYSEVDSKYYLRWTTNNDAWNQMFHQGAKVYVGLAGDENPNWIEFDPAKDTKITNLHDNVWEISQGFRVKPNNNVENGVLHVYLEVLNSLVDIKHQAFYDINVHKEALNFEFDNLDNTANLSKDNPEKEFNWHFRNNNHRELNILGKIAGYYDISLAKLQPRVSDRENNPYVYVSFSQVNGEGINFKIKLQNPPTTDLDLSVPLELGFTQDAKETHATIWTKVADLPNLNVHLVRNDNFHYNIENITYSNFSQTIGQKNDSLSFYMDVPTSIMLDYQTDMTRLDQLFKLDWYPKEGKLQTLRTIPNFIDVNKGYFSYWLVNPANPRAQDLMLTLKSYYPDDYQNTEFNVAITKTTTSTLQNVFINGQSGSRNYALYLKNANNYRIPINFNVDSYDIVSANTHINNINTLPPTVAYTIAGSEVAKTLTLFDGKATHTNIKDLDIASASLWKDNKKLTPEEIQALDITFNSDNGDITFKPEKEYDVQGLSLKLNMGNDTIGWFSAISNQFNVRFSKQALDDITVEGINYPNLDVNITNKDITTTTFIDKIYAINGEQKQLITSGYQLDLYLNNEKITDKVKDYNILFDKQTGVITFKKDTKYDLKGLQVIVSYQFNHKTYTWKSNVFNANIHQEVSPITSNLGLIIGLAVLGAITLGLLVYSIFKGSKRKVVVIHKSTKQKKA